MKNLENCRASEIYQHDGSTRSVGPYPLYCKQPSQKHGKEQVIKSLHVRFGHFPILNNFSIIKLFIRIRHVILLLTKNLSNSKKDDLEKI